MKPAPKKGLFHFKIAIEVTDSLQPGFKPTLLQFEVSAPPLPAKPSQPAFIPDEPHRIRLLIPTFGPNGLETPTPHGMDYKSALRLMAELALCLAITTPSAQNKESFENTQN